MGFVKYALQINAPLERVFALYTDVQNIPRWFPDVKNVEDVTGSMNQPGARFTIRFQGRPNAYEHVLEVIPNKLHRREFEQVQNGVGAWGKAAIHFRQVEGGTEVEEQVEFGFLPRFFAPLMSLLLGSQARNAIRSELASFKVFAEQESGISSNLENRQNEANPHQLKSPYPN